MEYEGRWEEGKLSIEESDLQKFSNDVYDKLSAVIGEQLSTVVDKDEITHESKLHSEFKTKLTEHFCGRSEILQSLNEYLNKLQIIKYLQ